MNADLGKKDFTAEEVAEQQSRLAELKAKLKLSWKELAGMTGIPDATIAAFTTGTYKGVVENIAGRAYRFFVAYDEQKALEATLPLEPDFQQTPSAQRMMVCLTLAHLGDMAVIAGAPGVGKTSVLIQYAATRSPCWRATMAPSTRGGPTMLAEILQAMGEKDAKGLPQILSRRIRDRVRNSNGLLMIDEAQYLTQTALEELRSIHDDTGLGIALVGDENLHVNLRKYPQLYSRIGVRHVQARPEQGDIRVLAEAWDIERGPELAYLLEIGRKGGGLRTISKTMKLALRAARAGGAPVTVGDLKDAFAQRYGEAA